MVLSPTINPDDNRWVDMLKDVNTDRDAITGRWWKFGDSLQVAPLMPKSGHMANAQAKVCAAAVVALLHGQAPSPAPVLSNTCYSWVSDALVVHVASVHKYDMNDRTMKVVPGSGGLSAAMNADEVSYALNWAYNIWADTLA